MLMVVVVCMVLLRFVCFIMNSIVVVDVNVELSVLTKQSVPTLLPIFLLDCMRCVISSGSVLFMRRVGMSMSRNVIMKVLNVFMLSVVFFMQWNIESDIVLKRLMFSLMSENISSMGCFGFFEIVLLVMLLIFNLSMNVVIIMVMFLMLILQMVQSVCCQMI